MGKSESKSMTVFAFCLTAVVICILIGVVIAFKTSGGVLADMMDFIRSVSFEGVSFSSSVRKAIFADFVFCCFVLIFTAGFPASLFPGGLIALKSFALGAAAGLAAAGCVTAKAAAILFVVFISNVLILPVYILVFLISLKFSARVCSGELTAGESAAEYFRFAARVLIFFIVMCVAECIQIGVGTLVLKLF